MKTILISIPVLFLTLFVYTKLAGPIPFTVTSVTTQKTDAFSVTGLGKTTVVPDIARVNVGISASGPTVKQTQNEINIVINKVSEAIKKLGIESKDIKTNTYSINPTYDYTDGKQTIRGYSAQTSLTVTIRDTQKANSVIDTATQNGANNVGGITFDVDDKTKAQNEARKFAVEDAKRKAKDASSIAGFTLGNIINYQENFDGNIEPRSYLMADKAVSESAPTQLEEGSRDISVTVTLSYEIR